MRKSQENSAKHSLAMRSHPLRSGLSEEMHGRKLPHLNTPCRLMQIVVLVSDTEMMQSRTIVETLFAANQATLNAGVKYAVLKTSDFDFVWEKHTEFVTYTFIKQGLNDPDMDAAAFAGVALQFADDLPGTVIRATQIAFLGKKCEPPSDSLLRLHFVADDLIVCDIADGTARIWSDFRLHEDGYGRLLIADQGVIGDEPAQIVQRLQELGNYRNMALLGLPMAQGLTPELSSLEARLTALTHAVSDGVSQGDELLSELTFLAAELARLMAETRYRMSATRAYAELSIDRLQSLKVTPVRGYQTLSDFTERRLVPAMRTSTSFSDRIEDLSQRVAWTSSLLRTRVDTTLAIQNRDLLASMNQRATTQLRLQQTVEGLSVVAITYYLIGLLGYVFNAVPQVDHNLAMGIAVPATLLLVAFIIRRIRRGLVEG